MLPILQRGNENSNDKKSIVIKYETRNTKSEKIEQWFVGWALAHADFEINYKRDNTFSIGIV